MAGGVGLYLIAGGVGLCVIAGGVGLYLIVGGVGLCVISGGLGALGLEGVITTTSRWITTGGAGAARGVGGADLGVEVVD